MLIYNPVKRTSFLFILGTAIAKQCLGCDLCSIYSATQAHGEAGKGFFAGAAEQFSHFGTVQVDGHEIHNTAHQHWDSSVSQAFVGYNFNDRLGLQFNLPVIYRSFQRPDGIGGMDRGTESGIGDASLLGNVRVFSHEKTDSTVLVNLLGGIKLPTGSTDRIKEEFDEVEEPVGPASGIHGHDLTLGSGSVDGIIGGSFFARSHRFFASGIVQYSIRSEGDYHYEFANDLTWSGGPGFYLFLKDQFTLGLQALVSGETKGRDTFQGETAEDTGVTSVYLGPQINLTWSEKLSLHVGADLPVSIQNTALQTVTDYRVHASLTWRF